MTPRRLRDEHILPLTYYPAEVLLKPAETVYKFDETLRECASDMFDTMFAARGVGLAAPQIGISQRLFVMDCFPHLNGARRLAAVNPEIVFTSGNQLDNEGCLSVPGYSYKVERPMQVVLRAQDLQGSYFDFEAAGLEARCILHETDHCNGKLYLSHLTPLKRQEILRSIRKKTKAGVWPPVYRYVLPDDIT